MKKFASVLLAALLMASATFAQVSTASTGSGQAGSTNKKSIVVYFSWSGVTESVAKEIASQTGSEIYRIEEAEPYTRDPKKVRELAQVEKKRNARPAIKGTLPDLSQYDTVYLGWPCWYSTAPMIMLTFLDQVDLGGKTLAPFTTSGATGFGSSLRDIKKVEPNAVQTKGLSLHGTSGLQKSVADWLSEIK